MGEGRAHGAQGRLDPQTLARVRAAIDPARLEALLVEAVARHSPSYAEAPVTRLFARALEAGGVPLERQPVADPSGESARANLIARLGPAEGPPALLWLGHVDTVAHPPQPPRREGGLLYGLGSADMKSGCAAIIEATRAIVAAGVTLRRPLVVGLVVGEEEYGDGAEALLAVVDAPVAIVGEPTGLAPCTTHHGYLELALRTEGVRAHAALPEVGASAIRAMLDWLSALIGAVEAPDAGFDDPQALVINPREIVSQPGLFIVPDRCEAMVDLHLAAGLDAEVAWALVEATRARQLEAHPGCALTAERRFWAPGYRCVDPAALDAFAAAFAALSRDWTPTTFRSHSDGSQLAERGIATLVCGPGKLEVAHTHHEHVEVAEVIEAAHLYAAMILALCG